MFLRDPIKSQTGIIISSAIIKRLMNGQFSRLPQIATLGAIAVTPGRQNWQQFKIRMNLEVNHNRKADKEK